MGALAKRYSSWWDGSAPDFALQSQLPICADIVIIGAGFTGISTVYWLLRLIKKAKKNGQRIVVLDEAPYAAFKSSGRTNGSIYLGSNLLPIEVADLVGDRVAKRLYDYGKLNNFFLEELSSRIQCDAEFNGGLRLSISAKEAEGLDESEELLSSWGYTPVRFDKNATQHMVIAPRANGGSLYVPGEGMFDPFAFTNKLARLLRKNNVRMVYGARVVETGNTEDGPYVKMANGHIITASHVVHTTPSVSPWQKLDEKIEGCREHIIKTDSLGDSFDDAPVPLMPVEYGNDSIRIHDRCLIATGGKQDPNEECDVLNDSSYDPKMLLRLEENMHKNFPLSFHTEVEYAWTYIATHSMDLLPLMGPMPDAKGHYLNVGHGHNKFGLAFLGARNIAERILRIKVSVDEFKIFDPKRFI